MPLDSILVLVAVGLALAYLVWRSVRAVRGNRGCSCSEAPVSKASCADCPSRSASQKKRR